MNSKNFRFVGEKIIKNVANILTSFRILGSILLLFVPMFSDAFYIIYILCGFSDLIDVIVGAEDVKIEKPNPEGLIWLLDYLNVEKSDIIYMGDSIVDAKTAENANVKFAAVLTGTTTRTDFENYCNIYIGENVSEVCKAVLDLD